MDSPLDASAELRASVRQQEVVAELGRWTVELRDVDELLHKATAAAARTLPLYQRIVERHGGDIWVDSEPGVESTFSFTLPVDSSHCD